jgi:DNA-directed RNA polymerase subunit A"
MKRFLTDIEIEDILDFIKPNKSIPLDCANSIVKITKDKFRKQLIKKEVYPSIIPELKNIIHKNYQQSLIDAGESVGILAAQSIGERQTQNSIAYDEYIIIKENNSIKKIQIGEFIDTYIELNGSIQIGDNSEISIGKNIHILSISSTEKIEWKKITEVSRHAPKGNLVNVTTESGRSVLSTLSHSHLKKENKKVVPVLGSDLKLNDKIPVMKNAEDPKIILQNVDISKYLNYDRMGPYEYDSDSDEEEQEDYIFLNNERFIRYIENDELFSWFLSLYLTNGSYYQSSIFIEHKNYYDNDFKDVDYNLKLFCEKYNIKLDVNYEHNFYLFKPKTNKVTYILKSNIFNFLLQKILYRDNEKIVPQILFTNSKNNIKSFLSTFFFYKGFLTENLDILKDIQFLLLYFGIYSRIVGSKIKIQRKYINLFQLNIGVILDICIIEENFEFLDDKELNQEIKKLTEYIDLCNFNDLNNIQDLETVDLIMENYTKNFNKRNRELRNNNIDKNLEYLKQVKNADVVWEKITKLELIFEKDYKHKYVYDFSVKGNETFVLFSGIVVHNTLNTLI